MVTVISVIVVALINFVIGMLWYSPVLFGNQWMKLNKFKKKDMKPKPGIMVTATASTFLSAAIMGVFILFTNAQTLGEGLTIGALAWVGFVMTTQLGTVLWEGKPAKLFLINTMHSLVLLLVAGGILAMW